MTMVTPTRWLLLFPLFVTPLFSMQAAGWRHDGTGIYPDAKPVTTWSDSENVRWKTALPNWGNSMPVLVDDKIFLTVEPDQLLCLSASDGQLLWAKSVSIADALTPEQRAEWESNQASIKKLEADVAEISAEYRGMGRKMRGAKGEERAKLEAEREALAAKRDAVMAELNEAGGFTQPETHPSNGYTSPTVVSDGERVYLSFGSGVLAAFDLEGNEVWAGFGEQPTNGFGHSSSPLLVDDKLIVHVNTMKALDPATGEILWSAEVPQAWGTSAVTQVGETSLLVTCKGPVVRVSDGKIVADTGFRLPYGSPIIHDGVIYAVDQPGGTALRLPETIEGETLTLTELWKNSPPEDRYYASPMVVDGVLYAVNRGRTLSAINAATGEILKSETLEMGRGQQLYGSISLADGHLFFNHDSGQTAVVKPGETFEVIGVNPLEPTRSTPVFRADNIFFRTDSHLFCLGQP